MAGTRGNGYLLSNNPDAQAATNYRGIEYRFGYPNYDPHSRVNVQLDQMSRIRRDNFRAGDKYIAQRPELIKELGIEAKNKAIGVVPRDVARWRIANGYTWHEKEDLRTLQLIPSIINKYYPHIGGVGELNAVYRLYDQEEEGDDDNETE